VNARAIDPAVRRLLDELPAGDPDDGKQPTALVWIGFCPRRHVIPLGQHVHLHFGEWLGPPMPLYAVRINVEVGEHSAWCYFTPSRRGFARRGVALEATVIVRPVR